MFPTPTQPGQCSVSEGHCLFAAVLSVSDDCSRCILQVVIVPILKKNTDTEAVLKAAADLAEAATSAGYRANVDAGTEKTPGFKFSFWEMKACRPLLVEDGHVYVGPKRKGMQP